MKNKKSSIKVVGSYLYKLNRTFEEHGAKLDLNKNKMSSICRDIEFRKHKNLAKKRVFFFNLYSAMRKLNNE